MNVNTRLKKMRKSRGFTLVELLIVIIIIGILAGGMLLVAGGGTDKANATKIVSDLRTLKSAALMYYADNNAWPSKASGDVEGTLRAYVDKDLKDFNFDESSGDVLLIGYNGALVEEGGVKKKLALMADDVALYASGGEKVDDEGSNLSDGVFMIVR